MKQNIAAFFLTVVLCFTFASAQTNIVDNSKQTNDKKLKIIKKPTAKTGRCSQSSGLAVGIVTFDKSGTISGVEIFKSSGCDNFDNNALKAARAIKFEPQIENGQAVTIKKQVEYTYQRY